MSEPDPGIYFPTLARTWFENNPEISNKQEFAAELDALESAAFNNILKRAGDGEVAAVNWLEERGFIHLPRLHAPS